MSTWNTEPPEDELEVLIRDDREQYLVAIWEFGNWVPANVQSGWQGPVVHHLDKCTIVWQELPE